MEEVGLKKIRMFEDLSDDINTLLKKFSIGHRTYKELKFYPFFILGLPRSGSTFLHQILTMSFDFNYVSNIKAFFYENISFGNMLHDKFRKKNKYNSNYLSEFGNTKGPLEPHEWGWFWRKWLKLKNEEHHVTKNIDWLGLKKELIIAESFNKTPLLFDTPYINGNLDLFLKNIGPIFIFNLCRSKKAIYKSLINARLKKYGSIHKFYGALTKDKNIKKIKDPYYQIYEQVIKLQEEKDKTVKLSKINFIHTINYEKLVENPKKEMKKVEIFLLKNKINLKMNNVKFPIFSNRNSLLANRLQYDDKLGKFLDLLDN